MNSPPRFALYPRLLSTTLPLMTCGALAFGCVHMPVTGVKATGEPLLADVQTENVQYVGKAKVGEVVNKDSAGRVVGTSEVYEDKLYSYDVTRWQVFQGQSKIDDEDFFRIAGDLQAADDIAASRQRAVTVNRVGWIVFGVGAAAFVAGLAARFALTEEDSSGFTTTPGWTTGVATGGALGMLVGGSMAWYGAASVKREHPIDDPRRAKRAAAAYNKENGLTTGEEQAPPEEAAPKKRKKKKKTVVTEEEVEE